MITKSVAEINKYVGSSVNPMTTPDQIYELYSVPSFESGSPEIVSGADIGSTKVVVEDGDILICKINPRINRVWVVHHNTEYPLLASSEWIVVRNATMNSDYLKWYFSSPIFHTLLTSQVTGIGGSLTRAQPKQVAKYPDPIPSRDGQDYVATILTCIDNLIRKYQQCIISIDQLVKSRFIELFGDPVINPKGFPCYTVGEVIAFQGGSQPDKKYFEYEASPDNIRLIQIRDYKSDKYITYIPKTMAKRFCTADDIMIGRYGPPIFQILKGIEGSFNVALMMATPKMGNREFVRQLLKQDCQLEYLEGLSKRTAGQDGIQMDKLKAYPFPYPPMELQEQFAAFVEQTDKSKFYIVQMQILLRLLIRAIQQKTTEVLL